MTTKKNIAKALLSALGVLIITTTAVFAQGPVYQPPVYQGWQGWQNEYQYHYSRSAYDMNYAKSYSQYGYNQVNEYWQGYQETGVLGSIADPGW